MKKILLSTALMIATAGVAAAEVTLSGSGRFGIVNNDSASAGAASTQIQSRLRFNVNAKLETDSGVTFGGRIRFQHSNGSDFSAPVPAGGSTGASFSPAMLYAEYNGLRVEVGNANSAYDSVALMYDSELGYRGTGFGDPQGSYYGFSSGPYDALESNRVGIYVAYTVSGVNLKASYIQPDQTVTGSSNDESTLAIDYTFGQITVAAAGAWNGGGIANNDLVFLGAAYAFSDLGKVGINYNDNGPTVAETITIYGNYKFGATTVGAYATDSDGVGDDTAFGIGASYDIGGATIAGSIQSGFAGEVITDLGVSMDF